MVLQRWHSRQTEKLRGVESSCEWLQHQCAGAYWAHISDTLKVVHQPTTYERWGLDVATAGIEPDDPSLDARGEYQNELAGHAGDMVLGIAFDRIRWGLDFLMGYPRRFCLMATDSRELAAAELRTQWQTLQDMRRSTSAACNAKARNSHLLHAPARQCVHILERRHWVPDQDVQRFAERRSRRIMSTLMNEEANRAQNGQVRRSATHRVSDNRALHALFESDLLARHKFHADTGRLADVATDLVIAEELFHPSEANAWGRLKSLPGWQKKTPWYSPGAEGLSDSLANLAVARSLAALTDMEAVIIFTPLLRGQRLLVKNIHNAQWYVILGTLSDCCAVGVSALQATTRDGRVFWEFALGGDMQNDWAVIPVVDPRHWEAVHFEWASPLWQHVQAPDGSFIDATGGRIVMVGRRAPEPLLVVAARGAFWDIAASSLLDIANRSGYGELPQHSHLFDLLWAFIQKVLNCADVELLQILKIRTSNPRDDLKKLEQFEEFKEVHER